MSSITRTLAVALGLLGLVGLPACLKPNPLAELELGGVVDTGTGTADDTPTDMLETGDSSRCESPTEFELACGQCLSESCCTSLEPCGEDPICVCEASCVFAGDNQQMCSVLCSAMTPDNPVPLAPLLVCAEQQCPHCFVQ